MKPLEQTTITDHSSEVLEVSDSSDSSEVLELEDDLTAILRSKDALIKTRTIENRILEDIVKQHREAIEYLIKSLKRAKEQFKAIQIYTDTAYFNQLTDEQVDGLFFLTSEVAQMGSDLIDEILITHTSESETQTSHNREG